MSGKNVMELKTIIMVSSRKVDELLKAREQKLNDATEKREKYCQDLDNKKIIVA